MSYEQEVRYYALTVLAFAIPVVFSFYFLRLLHAKLRQKFDIERHFAQALAIVHNDDRIKASRERVSVGVGSNKENIDEWTQDIWKNTYQDKNGNLANPKQVKTYVEDIIERSGIQMPDESSCFSCCFPNRCCKKTTCSGKRKLSSYDWDAYLEQF